MTKMDSSKVLELIVKQNSNLQVYLDLAPSLKSSTGKKRMDGPIPPIPVSNNTDRSE